MPWDQRKMANAEGSVRYFADQECQWLPDEPCGKHPTCHVCVLRDALDLPWPKLEDA